MTTRPGGPGEPASKDELLALVARMRAVSNATYDLFFRSGMGSEVHAFIEFNGLISKYVDICHRCAEQGIDFRFLNTHSGAGLPVEVHDMRYLGEKLDCILGPAIHANPAARDALRSILFGDSVAPGVDPELATTVRWAQQMRAQGFHVTVRDSSGRVLTPEGLPEGSSLEPERIAHVLTRQELIETRELLRELLREAKRGVPDESYPYRELWQRIEAILTSPVAEIADEWAKPADQPATGPLRRKLGVARGVLFTVLDSLTIGGSPMPTEAELREAIEETADP